jgi:hypothetical protein
VRYLSSGAARIAFSTMLSSSPRNVRTRLPYSGCLAAATLGFSGSSSQMRRNTSCIPAFAPVKGLLPVSNS